MKAIILAAGESRRLHPLTRDLPKCLLPIRGETFLSRQLRLLKACGIVDIIAVTGYCHDEMAMRNGDISLLHNPLYDSTGSIASLHRCRQGLDEDFLVLNCDIVFTKQSLTSLLSSTASYCLLVDNKPCDEEATKVTTEGKFVRHIDMSKKDSFEEYFGEYTGIAQVKNEGIEVFRQCLEECFKENPHDHWPTVLERVIDKGYDVAFRLTEGPWIEVDTHEDYAIARRLFE